MESMGLVLESVEPQKVIFFDGGRKKYPKSYSFYHSKAVGCLGFREVGGVVELGSLIVSI